ncbi:MAG: dihydroneopterin aldolase, partial [Phycisphaeraceae bacterium]
MSKALKHRANRSRSDKTEPLDRVFMHDLVLDVEIGVYTHEKGVTQRVRFTVDVDLLPATGALDDDIGRAFDYDTIIGGIKTIVARGHINLVETLAE